MVINTDIDSFPLERTIFFPFVYYKHYLEEKSLFPIRSGPICPTTTMYTLNQINDKNTNTIY